METSLDDVASNISQAVRLGVPVHLVNWCPGLDLEYRVVPLPAARRGAPPAQSSGGLTVHPVGRCRLTLSNPS